MVIKHIPGNNCIQDLPIEMRMTNKKQLVSNYSDYLKEKNISENRDAPPGSRIKSLPEWYPMRGVLIAYPLGITEAVIAEFSKDVIVYILVPPLFNGDTYTTINNTIKQNIQNLGGNSNNIECISYQTNTYWTRDYGPWWILDGNNDLGIVDFTYNRVPYPNPPFYISRDEDNAVPNFLSTYFNVNYYNSPWAPLG